MADRPIITLTTDFGAGSRYVAAMRGVILSINPAANVVDITHSIPPQNIAAGARVLADVAPWFPPATIHIAVVDPGVGTDREIVYAGWEDLGVVCPNNGLLTSLANRRLPLKLIAVENPAYWLPEISPTFHGRDIMAPVAAHLSLGLAPNLLGSPCHALERLDLPIATRIQDPSTFDNSEEHRVGQRIEGEVIEVDSFGNLITNISEEMLADCPADDSVIIRCDEHETMGVFKTYAEQPPMTLIALVGSSGSLELAIVDDSAKIMLGVGVGAAVAVEW